MVGEVYALTVSAFETRNALLAVVPVNIDAWFMTCPHGVEFGLGRSLSLFRSHSRRDLITQHRHCFSCHDIERKACYRANEMMKTEVHVRYVFDR